MLLTHLAQLPPAMHGRKLAPRQGILHVAPRHHNAPAGVVPALFGAHVRAGLPAKGQAARVDEGLGGAVGPAAGVERGDLDEDADGDGGRGEEGGVAGVGGELLQVERRVDAGVDLEGVVWGFQGVQGGGD